MSTGAIFARGSCRALRWLALAGMVFALGAGQAIAQDAPSPPVALAAEAGHEKVTLTWRTPTGATIAGYQVRYATGTVSLSEWEPAVVSPDLALSRNIGSLTNGSIYRFQVRSMGVGTPPKFSSPASISATPIGLPGVPTALELTPGDMEMTLEWKAPEANATEGAPAGYEYRYEEGPRVVTTTIEWTKTTLMTATVEGLENGKEYAFEVRSFNSAGPSATDVDATGTGTPATTPSAPENLAVDRQVAAGKLTVTLDWDVPAETGGSAILRYEHRRTNTAWSVVTGGDAATTVQVMDLDPNMQYTFEVRAVNAIGFGEAASASTGDSTLPTGDLTFSPVSQPPLSFPADTQIPSTTLPMATGGTGTITYSISALPDGLMFDSATRMLSGTPTTAAAATTVTYTAMDDGATPAVTGSLTFTITVTAAGTADLTFSPVSQPPLSFPADTQIPSTTLPIATGGTGTITYSISALPDGLMFDSATRMLSGTPTTAAAATTVTYTAMDDGATPAVTGSLTFTITVTAAATPTPPGTGTGTGPTIDEARYATGGTTVVIKMSEDVYLESGASPALLPLDFELSGGTIVSGLKPFRIDGLGSTVGDAADSFTLVFAEVISTYLVAGTPLVLNYSPNSARNIVSTVNAELAAVNDLQLVGPEQTSDLVLTIKAEDKEELEKARMRGTTVLIVLPAATGPVGATLTYTVSPTSPAGLTFTASTRTLAGTLPAVVGSFPVVYSVAAPGEITKRLTFDLNVADKPDAPVVETVTTAGPSSLTVTWKAPSANNDPDGITEYKLQYRALGAPVWIDVNATITGTTYTLSGLTAGTYQARVRALNSLSVVADHTVEANWSAPVQGSTGAAPASPTFTLTVDPTILEGRPSIPVKVTATVPPSTMPTRTLAVTLKLLAQATPDPETNAELPSTVEQNPDVVWASPSTTAPASSSVYNFVFTSNLSSEQTVLLNTLPDPDAEDENFRITATSAAVDNVFAAVKASGTKPVTIDDDEVQKYELTLPYAVESSKEFKEGYEGDTLPMTLTVSPTRTVATNFIVSLESEEDSSDYSLLTNTSGGPSSVSVRIPLAEGSSSETIVLTPAANDGDRVDDTITLQLFEASAANVNVAGAQLGDDIVLTVLDQHKLPTVSLDSIEVDGKAVTDMTLLEGQTATLELMADRGTTTDAVPNDEIITITLMHGTASTASAEDYKLSAEKVTIAANKTSGMFDLEVLEDERIDAEVLMLQAEVTGNKAYGDDPEIVDLGAISFMDGTMKYVYPKTDAEIQEVVYAAKEAGMGADMMFNPGETIVITTAAALFNSGEGVTLSYTAMSDNEDVATAVVSGNTVTVTAEDMAGVEAHITITAHATPPAAGAKGLPQTDPREASIVFPVDVGIEALSLMLSGPEDMNLVEGGMGAMVTATANRPVTEEVTVMLMRDRAMSTAGDDDYMADAIMIEVGMMTGSTMVMASEDNMMEEMEELVLYGMTEGMAGEVTGEVKLYLWDAAVPALPIIAQLLLAALLGLGGYRRYLRRR